MEHPDHTGASSNPNAPWNRGDPPRLGCDACDHEPAPGEAIAGDPCHETWDDFKARPQRFGIPCDGRYFELDRED